MDSESDTENEQLQHDILQIHEVLGQGEDEGDDSDSELEIDDTKEADDDHSIDFIPDDGLVETNESSLYELSSLQQHTDQLYSQTALDDQPSTSEESSLKQLLHINQYGQWKLQELLSKVEEQLERNQDEQVKVSKNPTNREERNVDLSIMGLFRDYMELLQDGSGKKPPRNEDTNQRMYGDQPGPFVSKQTKWNDTQRERLLEAVQMEGRKRTMQPLLNQREILESKMDRLSVPEMLEKVYVDIENNKKELIKTESIPSEELLGDRFREVDWDTTANVDLEAERSAKECQLQWQNLLHPSISRKKWTAKEKAELNCVAGKHEGRDWEAIAEELGTGRTALQCLRVFQLQDKSFVRSTFTDEEDAELKVLAQHLQVGKYVPFPKVAYFMEGHTQMQVLYRWIRKLDPGIKTGKFTEEEDNKLKKLILLYGAKNWARLAEVMSGRTQFQIRHRWMTVLSPSVKSGPWDYQETMEFLQKVKEKGVGNWSKVAAALQKNPREKERTSYHLLQRFKNLVASYLTWRNNCSNPVWKIEEGNEEDLLRSNLADQLLAYLPLKQKAKEEAKARRLAREEAKSRKESAGVTRTKRRRKRKADSSDDDDEDDEDDEDDDENDDDDIDEDAEEEVNNSRTQCRSLEQNLTARQKALARRKELEKETALARQRHSATTLERLRNKQLVMSKLDSMDKDIGSEQEEEEGIEDVDPYDARNEDEDDDGAETHDSAGPSRGATEGRFQRNIVTNRLSGWQEKFKASQKETQFSKGKESGTDHHAGLPSANYDPEGKGLPRWMEKLQDKERVPTKRQTSGRKRYSELDDELVKAVDPMWVCRGKGSGRHSSQQLGMQKRTRQEKLSLIDQKMMFKLLLKVLDVDIEYASTKVRFSLQVPSEVNPSSEKTLPVIQTIRGTSDEATTVSQKAGTNNVQGVTSNSEAMTRSSQLAPGGGVTMRGVETTRASHTVTGSTRPVTIGHQEVISGLPGVTNGSQSLAGGLPVLTVGPQVLTAGSPAVATCPFPVPNISLGMNTGPHIVTGGNRVVTIGPPSFITAPLGVTSGPHLVVTGGTHSQIGGLQAVTSGPQVLGSCIQAVATGPRTVARVPQVVASDPRAVISNLQVVASSPLAVTCDLQAVASGPQAVASGPQAVTSDLQAVASGPQAVASGSQAVTSDLQTVASGPQAVASGPQAEASGPQAVISVPQSVPCGPLAVTSVPPVLTTIPQTVASSPQAVAIGLQAVTSDLQAVSSSPQAVTSDLQAVASGPRVVASSPQAVPNVPPAVVSGPQAVASGPQAVASGPQAVTSDLQAVASGPQAVTSDLQAVASGPQAVTSDLQAVASGPQAVASSPQAVPNVPPAVVSGPQAVASGPQAVASGPQAVTSDLQAVVSGPQAVTSDLQAVASGPQAVASSPQAVPNVPPAVASGPQAAASGMQTETSNLECVTSGMNSHEVNTKTLSQNAVPQTVTSSNIQPVKGTEDGMTSKGSSKRKRGRTLSVRQQLEMQRGKLAKTMSSSPESVTQDNCNPTPLLSSPSYQVSLPHSPTPAGVCTPTRVWSGFNQNLALAGGTNAGQNQSQHPSLPQNTNTATMSPAVAQRKLTLITNPCASTVQSPGSLIPIGNSAQVSNTALGTSGVASNQYLMFRDNQTGQMLLSQLPSALVQNQPGGLTGSQSQVMSFPPAAQNQGSCRVLQSLLSGVAQQQNQIGSQPAAVPTLVTSGNTQLQVGLPPTTAAPSRDQFSAAGTLRAISQMMNPVVHGTGVDPPASQDTHMNSGILPQSVPLHAAHTPQTRMGAIPQTGSLPAAHQNVGSLALQEQHITSPPAKQSPSVVQNTTDLTNPELKSLSLPNGNKLVITKDQYKSLQKGNLGDVTGHILTPLSSSHEKRKKKKSKKDKRHRAKLKKKLAKLKKQKKQSKKQNEDTSTNSAQKEPAPIKKRKLHTKDISLLPPNIATIQALKSLLLDRKNLEERMRKFKSELEKELTKSEKADGEQKAHFSGYLEGRKTAQEKTRETAVRPTTIPSAEPGSFNNQKESVTSESQGQLNDVAPTGSSTNDSEGLEKAKSPQELVEEHLSSLKKTDSYQLLQRRFLSLFLWPGLLSSTRIKGMISVNLGDRDSYDEMPRKPKQVRKRKESRGGQQLVVKKHGDQSTHKNTGSLPSPACQAALESQRASEDQTVVESGGSKTHSNLDQCSANQAPSTSDHCVGKDAATNSVGVVPGNEGGTRNDRGVLARGKKRKAEDSPSSLGPHGDDAEQRMSEEVDEESGIPQNRRRKVSESNYPDAMTALAALQNFEV